MAARVKRGLPLGGAPCLCPPLGPPRAVRALGAPFRVRWPPSWGVPSPVLLGVLPLSLDAHRGRALLGWGAPSPFPPILAARVKRSRPFGGGPLCHRLVGHAPLCALSPQGVVPPFRPLGCAIPPVDARVRRSRPVWGGPSLSLPRRPLAPSLPLSLGCRPPLPSAGLYLPPLVVRSH